MPSKIREIWNDFYAYSTLHGLHFLFDSTQTVRRIIWAIFLLSMTLMFLCNGYKAYLKWEKHEVFITTKFKKPEVLKFPSVTICNNNMLKKSKIMDSDAQRNLNQQNVSDDSFNIEEEVLKNGHKLSDVVVNCKYQSSPKPCQKVANFTTLLDIRFGMCHTFNTDLPVMKIGETYGLQMTLDAESHEYYGPFSGDGTGFKIMIHDPETIPYTDEAINITPGYLTALRIRKKEKISLQEPYPTKCSEKKLKTSDVYSKNRCFAESYAREGVKQCNCTMLGQRKFAGDAKLCSASKTRDCLFPVVYKFQPNDCPESCKSITFDVDASSLLYPSESAWDSYKKNEKYLHLYNISNLNNVSFEEWYRARFAVLYVYFYTKTVEVTEEVPAFDEIDLAGNIGGNMGLYLGCSVLTLVEFLDLIMLVLVQWFQRKDKINISTGEDNLATTTEG